MSDNKVTNNIPTSIEGRDLVMERIFDGQRDLVFSEHWLDGGDRVDGKRKIGRLILRLTAYGIIACGAQMKTKVNFMAKNLGGKLLNKK
ncbi:hypothetical protein [Peribacillus frigoritolerans]|uniref:hypothetical protein n=1 Tax=Peribacillus frigoritolerans TaxID=450367 RepID=UPI0027D26F91|nr:hypothetical protein [Peribacillus frigoritolerans]